MNGNEYNATTQNGFVFPVGYHSFNKDKDMNYQLNRWHSLGHWTTEETKRAGSEDHMIPLREYQKNIDGLDTDVGERGGSLSMASGSWWPWPGYC